MGKRKRPPRPHGIGGQQLAIEAELRPRLGRVLQAEREARGWTQEQLAEQAGLHWTTIGKIERGRQLPSLALLALLAAALESSVTELVEKALPAPQVASEDATIALVRSLTRAERTELLPVLRAILNLRKTPRS